MGILARIFCAESVMHSQENITELMKCGEHGDCQTIKLCMKGFVRIKTSAMSIQSDRDFSCCLWILSISFGCLASLTKGVKIFISSAVLWRSSPLAKFIISSGHSWSPDNPTEVRIIPKIQRAEISRSWMGNDSTKALAWTTRIIMNTV